MNTAAHPAPASRLARLGARLALAAALLLPGLALAQTATAGDSKVNLSWTAPGGTVEVLILQKTSAITETPVNGVVYQPFTFGGTAYAPTTIGAASVAYVGNASVATLPVTVDYPAITNGTTYFFKVFARTAAGVWSQVGNQVSATPAAINTTTLADGTGNATGSAPPGTATAVVLDTFTLSVSAGADTVTSLNFTITPSGAWVNVGTLQLTNGTGTVLATITDPTANTVTFSGLSLNLTQAAGAQTYNVRMLPKSHPAMPPVPGATFNIGGLVTGFTCTNPKAGADTSSSTFTVDNLSPVNAAWSTVTPASGAVTLNWTGVPADAARIVILRSTASIADAPVEGSNPALNTPVGSATVAYTSATVATVTTTVSGLTNGQGYYFKIFAQDAAGNYSTGTEVGPVLPGGAATSVGNTISGTKAPVVSVVNPARGAKVNGSFRVQVRAFSPLNAAGAAQPIAATGGVQIRAYQGATPPAFVAGDNATLLAKSGTTSSGLWERTVTGLAAGTWTIDAQATSAAGTILSSPITITVGAGGGDGNLLVRDNADQLCADCHALPSHSTESGNTKYGSWASACRDCHAPHGTRNIFVVSEQVTPPPRGASGATTPKAVAFSTTAATGTGDATTGRAAASYANTDNTGVCQVCHTLTKYYRADGSSPGGTHQTGNRCTECHPHSSGMAINCTSCHGTAGRVALVAGTDVNLAAAPPRVASSPSGEGAHLKHVNNTALRSAALKCVDCHPATGNHDGSSGLNMVFGPLASGALSSVPLAPAYDKATTTCSNVWCHGAGLNAGGTNQTPNWLSGAAGAACGTCHGAPPTVGHVPNTDCNSCHTGYALSGLTAAAKVTHIDGNVDRPGGGDCTGCHGGAKTPRAGLAGVNATQINYAPPRDTTGVVNPADTHIAHINGTSVPVACFDCHGNIPVLGDPSHPDGNPFISLTQSGLANLDGGFAVAVTTAGSTTCSNVYCHGGTFAQSAKGANVAPTWGQTLGCGDCHGAPPGDPLHRSVAAGPTSCSRCHPDTVTAAGAIIVTGGKHVNGLVDSNFVSVPTSRGCSDCHGQQSRILSNNGSMVSFGEGAPPSALNGSLATTSVGVGVHLAHVDGTRSKNVNCSACHRGSTAFEMFGPNPQAGFVHADGAVQIGWDSLAAQGGRTPTYTVGTGGSCGTTYCHRVATPNWTTAGKLGCGACHNMPMQYTAADNFHVQNNNCTACHAGYTTTTVPTPARHVDGVLDVVALSCNTCHTTTGTATTWAATDGTTATTGNRVGAHAAHVGTSRGLSTAFACTECHGALPGAMVHANGSVNIAYGSVAAKAGTPTPAAGTIVTGSAVSCSNYCHGSTLIGGTKPATGWTSTASVVACGTCHFSTAPSGAHPTTDTVGATINALTQCVQCHSDTMNANGTVNVAGGFHVNGVIDAAGAHAAPFAPTAHAAAFFANQAGCQSCHGATYATLVATTGGSASCNTCHANPSAFNASGAYGTGVPSSAWQTDCTFCHGLKTRAGDTAYALAGSGTFRLNSVAPPEAVTDGVTSPTVVQVGAHLKHLQTTSAPKVQCTTCHGAMPPDLAHANGVVALSWGTPASNSGATSPTPAAFNAAWEASPTCTNYCHGQNLGAAGTITNPRWNVAADGACGTCHFVAGTSAVGVHAKHVNNAALIGANFACSDCHSTVVNATTQLLAAASTLHVNGTDNVSMVNRGGQSNGTYAAGSCAASYCHSTGQATLTPVAIAWAGSMTNVCAGCHGVGTTSGAPNYASGAAGSATANSHASHTGAGGSTCQDCHSGLVSSGGTAIAGTSHINGTREVVIRAALDTNAATSNYNTASKTCSSVSCHGTGTPQWGGAALKCTDCHAAAGTAADQDSFVFGTPGIISTTEWAATGHGQAAGALFTAATVLPTIAAGQPCLYCHDSSTAHDVATNPFRLHGATIAAGVVVPGSYNAAGANHGNDVCLNCHGATGNGIAPNSQALRDGTKFIAAEHYGAKHGASNGGRRCWDCHDPHGDGNIKMVGKKVVQTTTDLHAFTVANTTRVPASGTLSFTANTARTNFVNASFNGVCQVCHTTALHFSKTLNEEATHNAGQLCTNCHTHDQPPTDAFGAGAPHASPYPQAAHAADWYANPTGCQACHGATYGTLVATSGGSASCNTCHANPAAFNASGVYTGTGTAGANWQSDCKFCHGSTSLNAADTAYVTIGSTTVRYNQAAPPEAVADGVVATTSVKVGAHQKHFTTTTAVKVQCSACHGTTTPADLAHVNGVTALGWSTLATDNGNLVAAPTLFNATWEATPTCTVYCHGANLAGGTKPTPSWTEGATGATCGACHFVAGATSSGTHAKHLNNAAILGTNFACTDCHSTVVNATTTLLAAASTLHVNGTATVAMTARGGQSNGSYAAGSCAASYCHSSGQATPVAQAIAWTGTMTNVCAGCHGVGSTNGAPNYASGGAGAATANSHASHVTSDGTTCQDCHSGLVNAGGTGILGASHVNGSREVVIRAALDTNAATSNYNNATKTCSGVSCHGTGTPQWGAGAAAVTCKSCHATASAELEDLGANFWNNGTISTINDTSWLWSGHGKTTGTYDVTANPAAAFSTTTPGLTECLYCHDTAVAHKDANNPFRLRGASTTANGQTFSAYTTATPNAVCNNCHKTGGFGADPDGAGAGVQKTGTKKSENAHDGAKHTVATLGGKFCWDCHDPHGDRPNGTSTVAGENIAMIRSAVFAVTDGVHGFLGASGVTRPVTYYLQTATPPATGKAVEATTAVGTQHVGLCQACHAATSDTLVAATAWTKYWNRLGQDDADGVGGTAPVTSAHNSGSATTPYCVSCHGHGAKFAGAGECTQCHASAQGARRAINTEFASTWSHKRSAATAGTVTKYDCAVCHMEGDSSTGDTTTKHQDGYINLRDPDTGAHIKQASFVTASGTSPGFYTSTAVDLSFTVFRRNLSSSVLEEAVKAVMINQCLKCHDSNGASSCSNAAVPAGSKACVPTTGADAKPFGTTISGAAYSGAGVTAGGTTGGVTDVNASFATTNSSYHPVRGAQNNWYAKLTRMSAPWNATRTGTTANTTSWGAVISCWDCHAAAGARGLQTGTVTAHGGAATLRGAPTVTGIPAVGNQASLCVMCHAGYQAGGSTHAAGSALSASTNGTMTPYLNYGCNRCHASNYTTAVVRPVRAIDVHGVNALPTNGTKTGRWSGSAGTPAQTDTRPYAFIRNTTSLSQHMPARIGGSTYTPTCTHLADTPCSARTETYTPGGTY